jgi:proline dehydrogenase
LEEPGFEELSAGCVIQAYLKDSRDDLADLIGWSSRRYVPIAVRLVKGAYNEPADVAFPKKADVDEAYRQLADRLLGEAARQRAKPVFGTHDMALVEQIRKMAVAKKVDPSAYEFHMLYGIRADEQRHLASMGAEVRILISYGSAWFAWYMRRLAERPANVWFVLRNVV